MVGTPGQALSAAHPGPDPPANRAKADQVAGGTPVSCLANAGAARRPVAGSSAATAARQSDGDCGQAQPSSLRSSAVTSIHAGPELGSALEAGVSGAAEREIEVGPARALTPCRS